jgi:hypothetical protein
MHWLRRYSIGTAYFGLGSKGATRDMEAAQQFCIVGLDTNIQASKLYAPRSPTRDDLSRGFFFCFLLARTSGFHVRAAYFCSKYDRL